MMKSVLFSLCLATALGLALPAQAACYADYKAKRENPLKLHYGVMELAIPTCTMSDAVRNEVASRLKSNGWTLLQVLSVFDQSGLESRKKDAGKYFLRF